MLVWVLEASGDRLTKKSSSSSSPSLHITIPIQATTIVATLLRSDASSLSTPTLAAAPPRLASASTPVPSSARPYIIILSLHIVDQLPPSPPIHPGNGISIDTVDPSPHATCPPVLFSNLLTSPSPALVPVFPCSS
jgi:hypothetical protein